MVKLNSKLTPTSGEITIEKRYQRENAIHLKIGKRIEEAK